MPAIGENHLRQSLLWPWHWAAPGLEDAGAKEMLQAACRGFLVLLLESRHAVRVSTGYTKFATSPRAVTGGQMHASHPFEGCPAARVQKTCRS